MLKKAKIVIAIYSDTKITSVNSDALVISNITKIIPPPQSDTIVVGNIIQTAAIDNITLFIFNLLTPNSADAGGCSVNFANTLNFDKR